MRSSSGNSSRILWIIIILLLFLLGYAYQQKLWAVLSKYLTSESRESSTKPDMSSPVKESPVYPDGFSASGVKERTVDLNHNGKSEILLTSFSSAGGAEIVLIDSADRKKLLSNIFDFSTKGYPEAEFKSDDTPEVSQVADLDGDGRDEIILDLKSYGAYTDLFGALTFKGSKFAWAILEDETGQKHPAIFEDGASVRNANIFKVLIDQKPLALAQIYGGSQDGENWNWNADAYQWDGALFKRSAYLSAKIASEQPKKIVNGKPVF